MSSLAPTRIVSAPAVTGLMRHYFVRGSTLDGWRPQCGEYAKLVEQAPNTDAPQSAPGDIVKVLRTITPPGASDYVWLEHDGGTHLRCATLDTPRGERLNHGTVGVWEHCIPIVLATWPDGSTLDRLTSADRVGALAAVFLELPEEERRALLDRILPR